jgi:hypothetical protein
MQDQHLNSNNSNLAISFLAGRIAAGIAIALALALGAAALALPPALTGRLHPAAIPGALCVLVAIMALASLRGAAPAASERLDESAPGPRALVAACAAVLVFAVFTRMAGVALTTFAAGSIAAWGVAGLTPARALRIGLGLSAGSGVALSLLRQPLPILPPGFGW